MKFLLICLISFYINGLKKSSEVKTLNYKGYDVITVKGYDLTSTPGYPQLPRKTLLLYSGEAVPNNIKILNVEYEEVPGKFNILPAQPPSILPIPGLNIKPPPFKEPEKNIYELNRPFPESPLQLGATGNIDGFGVTEVVFYPFVYIPKEKKLLKVKSVEFDFGNAKFDYKRPKISRQAYHLLRPVIASSVMNSEAVPKDRAGYLEYGFDYLIITSQSLVSAFEPLKDWKDEKGLKTAIRTVEWIGSNYTGRDLQEKIRNYIKIAHSDSGVVWVLLGGDVNIVPARIAYAMCSGADYFWDEDSLRADLYYSDLDGTWDYDNDSHFGEVEDSVDLFPDVFVGRAPAENYSEAVTFVNKVIKYEKDPPLDYLDDLLFFAEILWEDPYTDAGVAKDMIDTLYIPENVNITKLYERLGNESSASVINAINQGKNLLNHGGHGLYYIMGAGNGYLLNEDMDNLINGDREGILYSIGCWVGAFDYDAISEHYLNNPNGGGVAFIGNSRYGWGSPGNPGYGYSDRFDLIYYKLLYNDDVVHIGENLAINKTIFIPYSRQANVYRWHQYQLNLLGDPQMEVWTHAPGSLVVSLEDTVPSGNTVVEIKVKDEDDIPIEDASVTLSNAQIYERTSTDFLGIARFTLQINSPDSILVTVKKQGFLPYQTFLHPIYEGGFPVIDSLCVDDSSANGDGYINPGEWAYLNMKIVNAGQDTLRDLSLKLRSQSDSLTLADSLLTIGELPPGASYLSNHDFYIGVSDVIDTTLYLDLEAIFTFQGDTITTSIPVLVASPLLIIKKITINSGGDTVPEPGESGELALQLKNQGLGMAESVRVWLTNESIYLNLPSDTFELGDIMGDSSLQFEVPFSISPLAPVPYIEVIDLHALSGSSYVFVLPFDLMIGRTGFYDNFEGGAQGWEATGRWHITTHRSHSNHHSYYCGLEDLWHYPNDAHDTLLSPPIVVGIDPVFSFYYWFDVATYGVDGIYVQVLKGNEAYTLDFIGSGGALDSLTNIGNSWVKNTYNLDFLNPADTARVRFVFVSDDEDWGEGFYIDDVRLNSYYQEERVEYGRPYLISIPIIISPIPAKHVMNLTYQVPKKGILKVSLYDVAGRKRFDKKFSVEAGQGKLNILPKRGLESGVYFVITDFEGKVSKKKVIFIK